MLFSLEKAREQLKYLSENSVNGTRGTVLFSKERRRTENTSMKNSVNYPKGTVLFSKKGGDLNNPVKNSVKGINGRMLFCR